MRFATEREITNWDQLVAANPDRGHILQTRCWAEVKARWGWQPRYVISEGPGGSLATLFLSRSVGPLGELWYAPKGPGIVEASELLPLTQDRHAFDGAFLVKLEPELSDGADVSGWETAGLRKAPRDVQITRATIIVDLRGEEAALLARFKPKTRYNIRLAARKGVSVRPMPVTDATIDAMYRLMAATQRRAGFTLRPRRYFEDYWRLQNAAGQGDFLFASYENTVLAGVFVTHFQRRAWYKDGGSTRQHSELMAMHLLQWETMRWLRARGIESYDLVAVPRPSELSESHPLYGLQRFKAGFSEHVTEFVGTWDLPLSTRRYAAWNRLGERIAHQWSYRRHHDLYY